jgi:hypothetical protein
MIQQMDPATLGYSLNKVYQNSFKVYFMKISRVLLVCLPGILLFLFSCNSRNQAGETTVDQEQEERIQVKENKDADRVDILIEGQLFTSYIHPGSIKKPVLFPVYTASGIPITRGFPLAPKPWERVDHPHHVGIWLNHGDVNDLDFWNNSDSVPADRKMHYGTIIHRSVRKTKDGDKKGLLEVEADWNRPDNRTLIRENSRFYFHGDEHTRVIDRITQLTATDLDVLFKDSKEGMLAIRVIRELEQPEKQSLDLLNEDLVPVRVKAEDDSLSTALYTSSEGLTGDAVWGTRARWVKLASRLDGLPVGIVIFDHPRNPDHPTHWHARGYGLFAANPFGNKMFTDGRETLNYFLPQGASVEFRYRIFIYDGIEPQDEEIERIYSEFVNAYPAEEKE